MTFHYAKITNERNCQLVEIFVIPTIVYKNELRSEEIPPCLIAYAFHTREREGGKEGER